MTAARPAIGSPCRSSGGHAVTLYHKAPRHPRSLRVFESETQRENRLLREENAALRRVLMAGTV